ncbi:hypothetical protein VCRA2120E57_70128 [Vibrio crassostreae]|uniref:hypothetical protein n=1 Tax=Vibrio sp. ZF 223 TaxID=2056191 RepID=UPI0021598B47|nr:hypothetical protein VCRA2120E57_70128 [Vibrio crassostreae]
MTINELKQRYFFKVMGKDAVSAAAISLPTLANATPTSPTNLPSDHQTVDSPLDATEMANLIRDKKASPKRIRTRNHSFYCLFARKSWANRKAPIAL